MLPWWADGSLPIFGEDFAFGEKDFAFREKGLLNNEELSRKA